MFLPDLASCGGAQPAFWSGRTARTSTAWLAWPMLPVSPTTDDTLTMRRCPARPCGPVRPGKKERAREVHGEHAVPVVRHGGGGLVHGDAGVVDQDVRAPVCVGGLIDRATAVARVPHCLGAPTPTPVRRVFVIRSATNRSALSSHGCSPPPRLHPGWPGCARSRPDATGAAIDEARQPVVRRRVRLARCGFITSVDDNSVLVGVLVIQKGDVCGVGAAHMPWPGPAVWPPSRCTCPECRSCRATA